MYIACLPYIRTHPYSTFVERETENKERRRHLDDVDDVVVAIVVVVAGVVGDDANATDC